jgi:fructose-1,6-bisphosphatase/inositol monophosphatase family enzyme
VHYHLLARAALDVVIESDVNILDIAALTVIVEEAGGKFTDLKGAASTSPRRPCSPPTARCINPSSTPCASEARRCRCSCAGESSEYSASPA